MAATRQLGFRLSVIGSDKTVNDLDKINKKLDETRSRIKILQSAVKINTNVDTSALVQLQQQERELKKEVDGLNKVFEKQTKLFKDNSIAAPKGSVLALREELKELRKEYLSIADIEEKSFRKDQLIQDINARKKVINEAEEAIGNFQNRVGQYKQAVQGIVPVLNNLQKEGILAQSNIANIFKADMAARAEAIKTEIAELVRKFDELGDSMEKAGERAAVIGKLDDKVKELSNVSAAVDQSSASFSRLGGRLLSISDIVSGGLIGGGAYATINAVVSGIKTTIQSSKDLSDAQSDVRKTTGLAADEIAELSEELKKLNTRTTTEDLLKISAVAGQLGVESKRGVLEFTKAIDVLNVALGDELSGGAEVIANTIAKLSNVLFGATTDGEKLAENMLHIGNALNTLSAEGAAGSEAIVNFASRIGRSLIPIGATADQVLALSATFDELNILPEQGATAVNNLIKDIGANTKLFAETLKINQDELRNTFNTDPIAAFDVVLRRVLELSGGDKTTTLNLLKDLRQTGEGVSTVFLQLSSNAELYQKNLKSSSSAIKETSSLFNEFRVKNENVAGVFDKLTKKIQDLANNPNIVKLIETLGKVLTGTVEVVGEVFGGLSALFDRITTDVSENGTRLEQSLTGVTTGALTMSEAQYTLLKGVSSVNAAIIKERAILESSIKILADETASRVTRNKVIDSLLEKYPGLLNKYQLEGASNKELIEIQKEVSAVMEAEVFKRIKAKTLEQLQTQRINLEILKAELELGQGLGKVQGLLAGLFGRTDEVIAIRKDQVTKELADLSTQIGKSEEVFNKTANNLNINFENVFNDKSYSKVRSNLAGLISIIEQEIDNNKIDQKVNALVLSVSDQATQLINSLKVDASKEELDAAFSTTVRLQKEYEAALGKTSGTQKGLVDLQNLGVDASEKQAKAAEKIKEQLERIRDLQQQIDDLRIDAIDDDFSQQLERVRVDTERQVTEIQTELNKLELKPIKTKNDQIEIDKSKELIAALKKAEKTAIDKINEERAATLKAATKELEDTRQEVLRIIGEINKTEIDIKISQTQFDLQQAEREIEIQFKGNIHELQTALAKGTITEEQFSKRSQEIEADRLGKIAKLYKDGADEFKLGLEKQLAAEIKIMGQSLIAKKQNIQDQLALDLLKVDDDLINGTIKTEADATAKKVLLNKRAFQEIQSETLKYLADKDSAEKRVLELTQQYIDKGVDAEKAASLARLDIKHAEEKAALDIKKDAIKQAKEIAKQEALALAQSISDTIFEIEENNNKRAFDAQRERVEENYENQIKGAQGNAAEIERLEREKAQKIAEIDRQENERAKKAAIAKAIIDSSLAVIKAFTSLTFPASLVAAAFIAAQTALQISKIKSQTFAKGAYFNSKGQGGFTGGSVAPPDETGERPIGTGVLHANEYIAPAKQTTKNDWLFNLLDSDRKRTNAGAVTDLETEIAKTIQKRRRVLFEIQTPSRRRFEPVIPIIIPFGGSGNGKIEFTDDQIDRLADAISERVERGATRGTAAGTSEGIKQATKEALREDRTNSRKAV